MVWFVPLLWKAAVIIPTAVYAIFTPFTADDYFFFEIEGHTDQVLHSISSHAAGAAKRLMWR
jgi:hypothetical protein